VVCLVDERLPAGGRALELPAGVSAQQLRLIAESLSSQSPADNASAEAVQRLDQEEGPPAEKVTKPKSKKKAK
ncbi:unnamed protein product, partial [Polarella glacialis]